MKKLLVYLMIAVLTVTCVPPVSVSASSVTKQDSAVTKEELIDDDGLMLREYEDFGGNLSKKKTAAVDSSNLTHSSRFNGFSIENGVDISHHNGVVDWNKVKADGVDFAIIRMAYRGYGSSGNLQTDNYAIRNLKNAKAAGLDVGVYIFSQALDVEEAEEEAAYILNLIKGYKIDLPVVIDYEYTAGEKGRLSKAKTNGMTDRERTDVCLAFCNKVEAAGYDAMVYANKSMLSTDLYADEIDAHYDIWLAEWSKKASYSNDYTYWQYTSSGSVKGVPSERVDLNVRYASAPFSITACTDSTITMEWRPVDGAEGYVIYRKAENEDVYSKYAWIDDPSVTTYTDVGLETNAAYSYLVRYYKIDENGNKVIYKTGYYSKKGITNLKLKQPEIIVEPVNGGAVKITWTKDPNAIGYEIQQYTAAKGKYEKVAVFTYDEDIVIDSAAADVEVIENGAVVMTVSELTAGTSYRYKVRSFAHIGGAKIYSNYSTPSTVVTSSKLTKPVLTAKSYSYTTNKLSWKEVPGASGYLIQRYKSADKKWVTIKTVSKTSYSDTYLNCNLIYRYRVRAIAKGSEKTVYSIYSDEKTAKTKGSRIGVVKEGPLNIRTGPGTGYKKIMRVAKGKKLTVTGSTAKWYRVKVKIKGKYRIGYVSKTYVRLK